MSLRGLTFDRRVTLPISRTSLRIPSPVTGRPADRSTSLDPGFRPIPPPENRWRESSSIPLRFSSTRDPHKWVKKISSGTACPPRHAVPGASQEPSFASIRFAISATIPSIVVPVTGSPSTITVGVELIFSLEAASPAFCTHCSNFTDVIGPATSDS